CSSGLQQVPIQYAPSVQRALQEQENPAAVKKSPSGEAQAASVPVPSQGGNDFSSRRLSSDQSRALPAPQDVASKEKPISGPAGSEPSIPSTPPPAVILERPSPPQSQQPAEATRGTKSDNWWTSWYHSTSNKLANLFQGSADAGNQESKATEQNQAPVGGPLPAEMGTSVPQPSMDGANIGDPSGGSSSRLELRSGPLFQDDSASRWNEGRETQPGGQGVERTPGVSEVLTPDRGKPGVFVPQGESAPDAQPGAKVSEGGDSGYLDLDKTANPLEAAPWQTGGASATAARGHYIQMGHFSDSASADKLLKRLKALNVPFLRQQSRLDGTPVMRVYVGPFAEVEEAQAMVRELGKREIETGVITNRLE
ncbi:MAG: SPOR domain-containing protein, partial [Magnetococcales bacterium]|nr:SPOR domain-containing protein [Magnetococcales bacterium]